MKKVVGFIIGFTLVFMITWFTYWGLDFANLEPSMRFFIAIEATFVGVIGSLLMSFEI